MPLTFSPATPTVTREILFSPVAWEDNCNLHRGGRIATTVAVRPAPILDSFAPILSSHDPLKLVPREEARDEDPLMYQRVAELQDIPTRQGRSFSQPAASSASFPSGQMRPQTTFCVLCTCFFAILVTCGGNPKLTIRLLCALHGARLQVGSNDPAQRELMKKESPAHESRRRCGKGK